MAGGTLVSLLRARAEAGAPGFVFLADGEEREERLDAAGLDAEARAIAVALRERGVAPGERALLLFSPGLAYIAAFFGAMYAGVVPVPAYPPHPARLGRYMPRLHALATDCGASAVLCASGMLPLADLAGPDLRMRWVATDAIERAPEQWREPTIGPDDLAFLQYTSGSTGDPRGVMLSHANLLANLDAIRSAFGVDERTVGCSWLPPYHDMGLIGGILEPLHAGIPAVLLSPMHFLERPLRWLRAISRHRATSSGGPDFAYALCAARATEAEVARLDLSCWDLAFTGAEPVRADTLARFAGAFGRAGFRERSFYPCYGLAEATLMVTGGRKGEGARSHAADAGALAEGRFEAGDRTFVDAGVPVDGTRVAIVDPTGVPVPAGAVGEIWVAGPGVAGGYWGRPESTTFGARTAEGDGPWLRTGDLGLFAGNRLVVCGRLKDLVIVRGRNVYPQDAERAAERAHAAVRVGSVAAFGVEAEGAEGLGLAIEVDPRKMGGPREVVDAARAAVAEACGVLPTAVVLVRPGAIPKTSSGKIRRSATKRAWVDGSLEVVEAWRAEDARGGGDAAVGSVEWLVEWVAARTGATPRPEDAPATLGLDSLAAAELAATVESATGRPVALTAVVGAQSLAALADAWTARTAAEPSERVAEPPEATVEPSCADGKPRTWPASPNQHATWLDHARDPSTAAWNLAGRVLLEGAPDADALARALDAVVARHAPLRARFPDGDHLRDDAPRLLLLRDPSETPEALAAVPFDLATGPLLRAAVWHRGPDAAELLLVVHHAVADLASLGVILDDLGRALRGEPLAPAPHPADRPARAPSPRDLAWWSATLVDLPPPPAIAPPGPPARATLRLSPALAARVRARAAAAGATPYVVLLAAFFRLLHEGGAEPDLVVGTPVGARSRTADAGIVGFLVDTVPVRANVAGVATPAELLARVRSAALSAIDHALPFPALVEHLAPPRIPGRHPVFTTLFTYEQAAPELGALATGLADVPFRRGALRGRTRALPPGPSAFDLDLTVATVGDALVLALVHPGRPDADALLARYAAIVEALCDDAPLGPDRATVERWEDGGRAGGVPLLDRLRAVPADAVAIVDGERAFSFGALLDRAGAVAGALTTRGVGADDVVVVAAERSAEMVVGQLAAWLAGAGWVVVEPDLPAERAAFVLRDCGARFAVTTERGGPIAAAAGLEVVSVDVDAAPPGDVRGDPRRLAYLCYTSGSTGWPKGVEIPASALDAYVDAAIRAYGLGPGDRVLQSSAPAFDASIEEIWATLAAGATVVIRAEAWTGSPEALLAGCGAAGVSVLSLPTAWWAEVARAVGEGRAEVPASVRLAVIGGEAAPPDAVRAWARTGVPIANSYGPTEATIGSTLWMGEAPADGVLPIGRPIPGWRVSVRRADGTLAEPGEVGELWIGGAGLARGYRGLPDRTAEAFVEDPGRPGERAYRTGDRARWRPDGQLVALGRADRQVKLRGYRVELDEVEAALRAIPGVHEAAAAVRDGLLFAWVTPADGTDPREALRARLPAAAIPNVVTRLDTLPRTATGKLDREALATPSVARSDDAPRTETEAIVAEAWAAVLGREPGLDDDFFALGGHSLLATRVLGRLRAALGVELPLRALFEAPTVRGLAARLSSEHAGAGDALQAASSPDEGPLSFAQERMWFLEKLDPGTATFHIAGAARLRGTIPPERLADALARVAARHPALRSRIVEAGGRTVQVADPPGPAPFSIREVDDLRAAAEATAARPFDLAAGPPWRVELLRGRDETWLVVVIHHIVADGWSLDVLLRDLAVALEGGDLPPLPSSYAAWAARRRLALDEATLATEAAWWRDHLGPEPPPPVLPTDRPAPQRPSSRAGTLLRAWPADLARRLEALAAREGATLQATLLAAFAAWLGRISGTATVVVGAPVSERDEPGLDEVVGLFVNTVALRVELGDDPSFATLVRRLRDEVLLAHAHRALPFEKVVEAIGAGGAAGRTPIFEALVSHDVPAFSDVPGLPLEPVPLARIATQVPLSMATERTDGGISARFEYLRDRFDPETVDTLVATSEVFLAAVAGSPDLPVRRAPLLDAGGHARALAASVGPSEPLRARSLVELLAEPLRDRPDHPAVVSGGRTLSYAALHELARRHAAALRAAGVRRGEPVALLIERSPEMVIGVLAALYAGTPYVPLDVDAPADRVAGIARDAGARACFTTRAMADRVPAGLVPVALDAPPAEAPPLPDAPGPDDPACVLYTSGSTGRPKGVVLAHRGFVHRLAAEKGRLGPSDRVLQSLSYVFDAATWDLLASLATGATLVLLPHGAHRDPSAIAAAAADATVLHLVPSLLTLVVQEPAFGRASVRRVLSMGEPLPPDLPAALAARIPGVLLENGYGPTEASYTVTRHDCVPGDPPPMPIGGPLPDVRAYVVDATGALAPDGVPGELWIGGPFVAHGYLGRPGQTAAAFVPDPWADEPGARAYRTGDLVRRRRDGALLYQGRIDQQVKLRGVRIEPGEVEAALRRHPGVTGAVVRVLHERLIAWVTGEVDPIEVRASAAASLPAAMVPAVVVPLTTFPRTASGKIDARALPDPGRVSASDPPRTDAERAVARVFAAVLGVPVASRDDDFFALGGHSLLATRIVEGLRAETGAEIPLRAVFEAPTVAGIAAALRTEEDAPIPALERGEASDDEIAALLGDLE